MHRKTTLFVISVHMGDDEGVAAEMQTDYLAAAVFLTSVWLAGCALGRFLSLLQVQCLSLCFLPGVKRHCTSLSRTQNTIISFTPFQQV